METDGPLQLDRRGSPRPDGVGTAQDGGPSGRSDCYESAEHNSDGDPFGVFLDGSDPSTPFSLGTLEDASLDRSDPLRPVHPIATEAIALGSYTIHPRESLDAIELGLCDQTCNPGHGHRVVGASDLVLDVQPVFADDWRRNRLERDAEFQDRPGCPRVGH